MALRSIKYLFMYKRHVMPFTRECQEILMKHYMGKDQDDPTNLWCVQSPMWRLFIGTKIRLTCYDGQPCCWQRCFPNIKSRWRYLGLPSGWMVHWYFWPQAFIDYVLTAKLMKNFPVRHPGFATTFFNSLTNQNFNPKNKRQSRSRLLLNVQIREQEGKWYSEVKHEPMICFFLPSVGRNFKGKHWFSNE